MVVQFSCFESFADIFDVRYTARMEDQLDDIEEGKIDWREAMGEFYERFTKDLETAETQMTNVKRWKNPPTCCATNAVSRW